jgi:hypothetical protein
MSTKTPHEEKQIHEFVRKTWIIYGKMDGMQKNLIFSEKTPII